MSMYVYVGLKRKMSLLKGLAVAVPTQNTALNVCRFTLTRVLHMEDLGISKYELGKPLPGQPVIEKVLMLVGASGAGKSTLINGMVNYIYGVKWDDDVRFQLISEESTKNQTLIAAYTIYPRTDSVFPYTLTIVDTPSFNDAKHDQLFQQIKEFFSSTLQGKNGIDHLDGIGFVIQSSLARLTIEQRMFNSILSIFGNDVASNIFMMVTFADASEPPVMAAIKEANIQFKKMFKFNNSALYASNSLGGDNQDYNFNSMFWKMGTMSFQYFFEQFCGVEQISLYLTKEVLQDRKQLEVAHQALQQQIDIGVSKLEELKQEEEVLHQKEAELAANKDFTYSVTVTKQKMIHLQPGVYSINCLKCEHTCHTNCRSKDNSVYTCSYMDKGGKKAAKCQVCPKRCSWTDHRRCTYCWEPYKEVEIRTSQELQQKFVSNLEGKSKAEIRVHKIKELLENAEKDLILKIKKILDIMHQLDKKALKRNPITQNEYMDSLISAETEQKKPGYQQRTQIYEGIKQQKN